MPRIVAASAYGKAFRKSRRLGIARRLQVFQLATVTTMSLLSPSRNCLIDYFLVIITVGAYRFLIGPSCPEEELLLSCLFRLATVTPESGRYETFLRFPF